MGLRTAIDATTSTIITFTAHMTFAQTSITKTRLFCKIPSFRDCHLLELSASPDGMLTIAQITFFERYSY
jgi:hypothetical protein